MRDQVISFLKVDKHTIQLLYPHRCKFKRSLKNEAIVLNLMVLTKARLDLSAGCGRVHLQAANDNLKRQPHRCIREIPW